MKTKIFLKAAGQWLVLAATLVLSGCPQGGNVLKSVVKPPEVSVEDVSVTGISSSSLDLTLALKFVNPNPIGLKFSNIEYNLELAGRPLAKGQVNSEVELKASGTSTTQVPMSVAYREMAAIYDAAKGQDQVPYRVSGKAVIATPLGDLPIPFDVKGKLPVVRPPKIVDVGVHVEDLSLTGAKLALLVKLENPNLFPLAIQQIDYALALENQDFSAGKAGPQTIPAKATGIVLFPMTLNFGTMGNWAYTLLLRGQAQYSLSYQGVYLLGQRPLSQKEQAAGKLSIRK